MTKHWEAKRKPQKKKRRRATVVAEQDGKVLLVREKGSKGFSLPGGGIETVSPQGMLPSASSGMRRGSWRPRPRGHATTKASRRATAS